MASGIKIENLKKSFNSAKGVITPIDNFSLDISANELTTVIGKSGCGKTTLLKLISGKKLKNREFHTCSKKLGFFLGKR